jgi:hypothetical protein
MDFFERLAITKWMLQREGRISYAALKREFGLDDDTLENLRYELIVGQRLAADEDGEVLVWTGGDESSASPSPAFSEAQSVPPLELAPVKSSLSQPDKIVPIAHPEPRHDVSTETPSTPVLDTEAERRQLTVMFCDLVGSVT